MSTEFPGTAARIKPARSLINPVNFLLATRDTGYKSTALVLAELVDNSIQAGAGSVSVTVSSGNDPQMPVEITVVDDGEGMDASTLGGGPDVRGVEQVQ